MLTIWNEDYLMKDIVIVGAGHLGVDVYYLIREINEKSLQWRIRGFINDVPADLARWDIAEPIIGTIQDWSPVEGECYAMAIGSADGRHRIAELLKSRGCEFVTLISPYAIIYPTAEIGNGSIVISTSKIGPRAKVGDFCCIGDSTIGAGAIVGDYSTTASYANIYQDIVVGSHTIVWSHAVVLRNVGDHAVVGAGSVVTSRVRNGDRVFGSPARSF